MVNRIQGVDPALYSFEGKYFERDGLRLHYLDEGQGETVVMVHGNPTWSFYYRELVKALRGEYRVIVPDHMGCGLSDKPSDAQYEYCLERRVDDLAALLDSLGLERQITLVVHDWGGMIGMAYASRHPERIARLVIMNTSAFHLPASKAFPFSLWLTRTPLGTLMVRGMNAFSRGANRLCVTRRPLAPEVRRAYLAPYDSWRNRIAVLRFVQDIPLREGDRSHALVSQVEQGLDRFQNTPMLLCWGERDFVFSAPFLEEWLRRFPKAEVHRFADAGHYVLEDAFEDILPLIQGFLVAHPLASEARS